MSEARDDARLRRLAREVFANRVGIPPRRIRALPGGLTNRVYAIDSNEGAFILRMDPASAKLAQYRKERWAIDHARRMDIPAPKVADVGLARDGTAYMLARREPGRPATELADATVVLKQLGQYAARLHETTLSQYGAECGGETAAWPSWPAFLEHEFKLDERVRQLRELDLVSGEGADRLAEAVARLGDGREARLNHGDLRLKNVLVDPHSQRVSAVIDWECAVAAPAPEWDLALALHDLSVDEKDAFLDGYGLGEQQLLSVRDAIAALNMLHYAPFAAAAARSGDERQLQRYRRRFARVYDLYSP